MKPTITWIVIADGAEAKIFEHDGPGKGLRALPDLHLQQKHLKASDIMADRQGRSFQSAGPGSRSAIAYQTDPVDAREERFVEHVAALLNEKFAAGAFTRLIIAANPTSLGEIRPALSAELRAAVIGELPKDLTNTPTAQLAAHFDSLIAV